MALSLEDIIEEYEGQSPYSYTEEREETGVDDIEENRNRTEHEENIDNEVENTNEEAEGENEEQDDDDDAAATPNANVVKKRIVQRPRVTLNADRICSKRGLPDLLKQFEGVKFKGKKHEKEDLDNMMSILEHWAHRLMPRFTFDDCLAEIEKLGNKKPVQVFVKKIRLDLPLVSDDHLAHEEEEENNLQQTDTLEPERSETTEDIFNQLIREEEENLAAKNDGPNQLSTNTYHVEETPSNTYSSSQSSSPKAASGQMLNDELLWRIERNRRRAEEFRRAKLNAAAHNLGTKEKSSSDLVSETNVYIEETNSIMLETSTAPEETGGTLEKVSATQVENSTMLEESSDTLQETTAAPQETSDTLQETSAAPQETSAAPQETSPALQETSPALQETSPAIQETSPAIQETSPAFQETSPALQETSPASQVINTSQEETSATPQGTSPAPQETSTPPQEAQCSTREM